MSIGEARDFDCRRAGSGKRPHSIDGHGDDPKRDAEKAGETRELDRASSQRLCRHRFTLRLLEVAGEASAAAAGCRR
ncbi:MAG TPA: hypothetical protein VII45_05085, partial [Solirubrobacterales bacterium]